MALLDAYGRSVRRRKLPPGLDVFWQLPQVEALTAWDVAAAKAAASAHETGDFTISGRMFWAMLADPRIVDGCTKRALARRSVKYKIVPGKGQRTVGRADGAAIREVYGDKLVVVYEHRPWTFWRRLWCWLTGAGGHRDCDAQGNRVWCSCGWSARLERGASPRCRCRRYPPR